MLWASGLHGLWLLTSPSTQPSRPSTSPSTQKQQVQVQLPDPHIRAQVQVLDFSA